MLTWDWVELRAGLIRLCLEDTKTQAGRIIPLTKELTQMLQQFTIHHMLKANCVPYVFSYASGPSGVLLRRPVGGRGFLASCVMIYAICS
jgi:hypothetical protein